MYQLPPELRRIPTSVDNMKPGSTFVETLGNLPFPEDLHLHSIIPNGDYEGPEGAHDGVVTNESAHLEEVDSEVLVPSEHSCQGHPRTLLEIRRILYEELGLDAGLPIPSLREPPK